MNLIAVSNSCLRTIRICLVTPRHTDLLEALSSVGQLAHMQDDE